MPAKVEIFKKYPNNILIETGSYLGDGIQQALDAGFERVISIELSDKYFEISKKRFIGNDNVEIYKGDSFKVLPSLLLEIKEPVTFWLDGHHSGGDTALGEYWAPLIQELDVIKNHSIKNHTIMVDDMRCWLNLNDIHGFSKNDIIDKIYDINPNYEISYEHGFQENDILIAL